MRFIEPRSNEITANLGTRTRLIAGFGTLSRPPLDRVNGDRHCDPDGRDEEKPDKEPGTHIWHCGDDRYCGQHERDAEKNRDYRDKGPENCVWSHRSPASCSPVHCGLGAKSNQQGAAVGQQLKANAMRQTETNHQGFLKRKNDPEVCRKFIEERSFPSKLGPVLRGHEPLLKSSGPTTLVRLHTR